MNVVSLSEERPVERTTDSPLERLAAAVRSVEKQNFLPVGTSTRLDRRHQEALVAARAGESLEASPSEREAPVLSVPGKAPLHGSGETSAKQAKALRESSQAATLAYVRALLFAYQSSGRSFATKDLIESALQSLDTLVEGSPDQTRRGQILAAIREGIESQTPGLAGSPEVGTSEISNATERKIYEALQELAPRPRRPEDDLQLLSRAVTEFYDLTPLEESLPSAALQPSQLAKEAREAAERLLRTGRDQGVLRDVQRRAIRHLYTREVTADPTALEPTPRERAFSKALSVLERTPLQDIDEVRTATADLARFCTEKSDPLWAHYNAHIAWKPAQLRSEGAEKRIGESISRLAESSYAAPTRARVNLARQMREDPSGALEALRDNPGSFGRLERSWRKSLKARQDLVAWIPEMRGLLDERQASLRELSKIEETIEEHAPVRQELDRRTSSTLETLQRYSHKIDFVRSEYPPSLPQEALSFLSSSREIQRAIPGMGSLTDRIELPGLPTATRGALREKLGDLVQGTAEAARQSVMEMGKTLATKGLHLAAAGLTKGAFIVAKAGANLGVKLTVAAIKPRI